MYQPNEIMSKDIFPESYPTWRPSRQVLYQKAMGIDENGFVTSGLDNIEQDPINLCKTGSEKKIYFSILLKYGVRVGPSEFDKYPLD